MANLFYVVKSGPSVLTFATKNEAEAYAAQQAEAGSFTDRYNVCKLKSYTSPSVNVDIVQEAD